MDKGCRFRSLDVKGNFPSTAGIETSLGWEGLIPCGQGINPGKNLRVGLFPYILDYNIFAVKSGQISWSNGLTFMFKTFSPNWVIINIIKT